MEIKSQAAVDALGVSTSATVLVSVWEELNALDNQPGLTG
jgi:hypothetical protein